MSCVAAADQGSIVRDQGRGVRQGIAHAPMATPGAMRARSAEKQGTAHGCFAAPGGMGGEDAREMRERRSQRVDHLCEI